jgi:hypothetical protein
LSSAYGLSEYQTSLIQRTCGVKYFNMLDKDSERDKKYIELFVTLDDLICEESQLQSMLRVSLAELREEVYIRMLNNLNVIGKTGETIFSEIDNDDSDFVKEKYPEVNQMMSSIEGMRKNINNFTVDTGYFEKELGLFADQNGTSSKGKYFKVLN